MRHVIRWTLLLAPAACLEPAWAPPEPLPVTLLTPAYVAGAIAADKEKRTLEFLFATDLRNREIVLSKLGARLANLVLFLLAGLPILSFVQFLGGVDPNLVLAGFAATGMTMLGLAAVSILFSVICRRPRDAIAMTDVKQLLLDLQFGR